MTATTLDSMTLALAYRHGLVMPRAFCRSYQPAASAGVASPVSMSRHSASSAAATAMVRSWARGNVAARWAAVGHLPETYPATAVAPGGIWVMSIASYIVSVLMAIRSE